MVELKAIAPVLVSDNQMKLMAITTIIHYIKTYAQNMSDGLVIDQIAIWKPSNGIRFTVECVWNVYSAK